MKFLRLRTTTLTHGHPLARRALRAATVAEFAASLVCFLCLVCLGAPAGAELPAAEPPVEFQEAAAEGEDDGLPGSPELRLFSGTSGTPSVERHARLTSGDTDAPASPGVDALGLFHVFPSPRLLSGTVEYPVSHAPLAQLLLVSVPTRGPTFLS